MSRYIEVDHLKKSVEGLQDCYNGFSDTYDKACIIGLIDEEPTADVVPVVRCKDCKHFDDTQKLCNYFLFRNGTSPEHYCSAGRRKE